MHRLRGVASDVHEEHTADGVIFEARLPVSEAGRYARFLTDVREPISPDEASEIDEPPTEEADPVEDVQESPDVR